MEEEYVCCRVEGQRRPKEKAGDVPRFQSKECWRLAPQRQSPEPKPEPNPNPRPNPNTHPPHKKFSNIVAQRHYKEPIQTPTHTKPIPPPQTQPIAAKAAAKKKPPAESVEGLVMGKDHYNFSSVIVPLSSAYA